MLKRLNSNDSSSAPEKSHNRLLLKRLLGARFEPNHDEIYQSEIILAGQLWTLKDTKLMDRNTLMIEDNVTMTKRNIQGIAFTQFEEFLKVLIEYVLKVELLSRIAKTPFEIIGE